MTAASTPALPPPPDQQPPGDARFTFGLVHDVAKVLEAHGYPPVTEGRDLVELQAHLFHYCDGRERGIDRCYGGAR